MKHSFLLILFSLVSSFPMSAQHSESCGTDEHHQYLMKTSEPYATKYLANRDVLRKRMSSDESSSRQLPPVYTIPLVVHIVHLGEPIGVGSNISEAQVYDAIEGLNDRFANANGMGFDIEVNFCLANRDPNGCPTSGINRVDGRSVPNFEADGIWYAGGCGAEEFAIKALSQWPVDQYYNVWVVHDICGDIAGYAYYPNGEPHDGTVVDVPNFNSSSRVFAHELGHGFNLQHTFSGDEDGSQCPSDFNCLFDGDEVCDTPPHRRNDCGLNNPCGSGGEWDDSRYNWMSYCPTSVELGRFTNDQRERMRTVFLEWPRASLTESLGCSNEESMEITSDNSLMCSGEMRTLSATPEGGEFVIADGPATVDSNMLTATAGGNVVVEYIITQENCTSSVFQSITVKQSASAKIVLPEDGLCVGETMTLTGLPSNGVFTLLQGDATLDGKEITPNTSGPILLDYTAIVLGCPATTQDTITANEKIEAKIELIADDLISVVVDSGVYQWLACDLDFEVIEGATEPTYLVPSSGAYALEVRNGACRDTSECLLIELTSTHDHTMEHHVQLAPNPASHSVQLIGTNLQNVQGIRFYTIQGTRILEFNTPSSLSSALDISSLYPGMYIVVIRLHDSRLNHLKLMVD